MDASDFWNLVPDYEVKHYINLIRLNQVLLIADACFSSTLLTAGVVKSSNGFGQPQQACIEIIASGNLRVPDESEFNTSLIEILKENPKATLVSYEIYQSLKMKLTDKGYYQPQYGSLSKSKQAAQFVFSKISSSEESIDPIASKISDVIAWFKKEKRRMAKASEIKDSLKFDDSGMDRVIEAMVKNGSAHLTKDNIVFLIQNTNEQ